MGRLKHEKIVYVDKPQSPARWNRNKMATRGMEPLRKNQFNPSSTSADGALAGRLHILNPLALAISRCEGVTAVSAETLTGVSSW
jgi:hypothetical protein